MQTTYRTERMLVGTSTENGKEFILIQNPEERLSFYYQDEWKEDIPQPDDNPDDKPDDNPDDKPDIEDPKDDEIEDDLEPKEETKNPSQDQVNQTIQNHENNSQKQEVNQNNQQKVENKVPIQIQVNPKVEIIFKQKEEIKEEIKGVAGQNDKDDSMSKEETIIPKEENGSKIKEQLIETKTIKDDTKVNLQTVSRVSKVEQKKLPRTGW